MKEILVILAGGRPNGNTAQLADAFTRGAEHAGHHVEAISLLRTEVRGCTGCNACRHGAACIQKDDFHKVIPKIEKADLLAFASPLYFWTFSARLKAFVERFYSLAEDDPAPPFGRYEKYPEKDCVLLMTAADNLFWTFEQAVSYYRFTLVHYMGFHDRGMVLAGGCGGTAGKPQIQKTSHLQRAFALGESLYQK